MSGDITGQTYKLDARPGIRLVVGLTDEEARALEDACDEYAHHIETWDEVCEPGQDRSEDQIRAHALIASAGRKLAAARGAAGKASLALDVEPAGAHFTVHVRCGVPGQRALLGTLTANADDLALLRAAIPEAKS